MILLNRHWQHYKADPDGWNWLEYFLFLLPCGFYIAFALRWLRLGGRAPAQAENHPDPEYQKIFQKEVLDPIVKRYFRGALYQVENLPSEGPLIIAMNHAGMCFPWDFVGLGLLLAQAKGWYVQPFAHAIFFDHPWLVWWLPPGWIQVLGGVRAERESFEEVLASAQNGESKHRNDVLLYAPEGWRGLAKGWLHRYQLATFDPSFMRLSVRYQVPILPIACIGSEYLHPFSWNARRIARWLKLPMFPLSPLIPIFLLFPSLGVWAVRTRLQYYVQPVWRPWEESHPGEEKSDQEHHFSNKHLSQSNGNHPSRAALYQMGEQLRSRLQSTINQLRHSAKS